MPPEKQNESDRFEQLKAEIKKLELQCRKLQEEVLVLNQSLKHSEESISLIERVFENSALSTWISDAEGTAIRTNRACLEFFGATAEEVIGKYNLFKDAVIEEQGFMPDIHRVFEKAEVVSFIIDYDFGSVDHVDVKSATHKIVKSIFTPIVNPEGKVINVIVQGIDLSEIEQARQELQISKENLALILDHTYDAIIRHDISGKIVEVNKPMLTMYGLTEREALSLNIKDISSDKMSMTEVEKRWKRVLKGEELVFEWEALRPNDRSVFVVEVFLKKISLGGSDFILSNVRDITDKKKAELEKKMLEGQLHQSQKMEAVGTLAGGIAHNFNNILMGIQGYASLLRMDKDAAHPDYEYLSNIEQSVHSAVELTKQLLGFARGGKYEVKPLALNTLIQKENHMFGQTKKEIRIDAKFDPDLWLVEADEGQIRQVLLNLYVNAWQAMPKGGIITVQTENIHLDDKSSGELAHGPYVQISVSDTGVGMDSNTQQKVFEPFFSTKEIGLSSGLGLASAYGIIQNHAGKIEVFSKKGEGSTFRVLLPATDKRLNHTPRSDGQLERGEGNILLVDDEPMVLQVAEALLKKIGYDVLTADSGEMAIDLYRQHRARIQLIILDMVMPEMGGGPTFEKLIEIDPSVPILLSSGYSISVEAEDILKRGCKGFLQKPFTLHKLASKIKQIIG